MNLASFNRGSFFWGEFTGIGSGCVAFLIKFRYLTGIKKICEEVIRNYSIWRKFPIPVFRDKFDFEG